MKKPLSREKLEAYLDTQRNNFKPNGESYRQGCVETYDEINSLYESGSFDEDEPAFDVQKLKKWLTDYREYLESLNKGRYIKSFEYIQAESAIIMINKTLAEIESKLKKESEILKSLVCYRCKKDIDGCAIFGNDISRLFCSKDCLRGKEPGVQEEKKYLKCQRCGKDSELEWEENAVTICEECGKVPAPDKNLIDADGLIKKLNEMLKCHGSTEWGKGFDFATVDILKFINSKLPAKEEELKPCPFCGGQALLDEWCGSFKIRCSNDDCDIKPDTYSDSVKSEVIRLWNKRAGEQA